MGRAEINWTKAQLRLGQALRGLGRFDEAQALMRKSLNRFRGDPASGRLFRAELKLCEVEETALCPEVLERKVMGIN